MCGRQKWECGTDNESVDVGELKYLEEIVVEIFKVNVCGILTSNRMWC